MSINSGPIYISHLSSYLYTYLIKGLYLKYMKNIIIDKLKKKHRLRIWTDALQIKDIQRTSKHIRNYSMCLVIRKYKWNNKCAKMGRMTKILKEEIKSRICGNDNVHTLLIRIQNNMTIFEKFGRFLKFITYSWYAAYVLIFSLE